MNLYSHQSANIRKTWILFGVFLVFVIGLGWVFSRVFADPSILWFAVFFSLLMNILSYWYSDKLVLAMARAKRIEKRDAPELYNMVENLSIAAGLRMPGIYIIP